MCFALSHKLTVAPKKGYMKLLVRTVDTDVDMVEIIYTIICLKSVCLSVWRRSQTAGRNSCSIASGARSAREMSQTDRIVWQYILSRVRISVRPSIFFIREKTSLNYRECRVSRIWLLNEKGRNAGLAGDRSTVSGKHTRAFNGHSTDRLSQHDENNKSKRRQREFIHSRLENVV